jgi:hypothetical protein
MQNNRRYFATRHRQSFLRFISSAPSSPADDSDLSSQQRKNDILSDVNSAHAFLDAMSGRTFDTSSDDESSSEESEDDSNYTDISEDEIATNEILTQDNNPQPVPVRRIAAILVTSMPSLELIDHDFFLFRREHPIVAPACSEPEPPCLPQIQPRKESIPTYYKPKQAKIARKYQPQQPAKSQQWRSRRTPAIRSVTIRLKDRA